MKMNASNRMILAILVVVAVAVAFWMLLLGPKREEASELGEQVEQLQVTLAQSQQAVATAEAARKQFPHSYQQLVVLGKAVPASDETASLLVELNHIADRAGVTFESIQLGAADGSGTSEAAPEESAPTESAAVSGVAPTEAAAALQPLGAVVGPAGLSILPYDLTFSGSFFDIADFIEEIDGLVDTKDGKVAVNGRLMTLDGFALSSKGPKTDELQTTFSVTTYLVPPGQGVTAGATEEAPAEATPASETTTANEAR